MELYDLAKKAEGLMPILWKAVDQVEEYYPEMGLDCEKAVFAIDSLFWRKASFLNPTGRNWCFALIDHLHVICLSVDLVKIKIMKFHEQVREAISAFNAPA